MLGLILFFLGLIAEIAAVASLHRVLKGRWQWRTLLTLALPLLVVLFGPRETPYSDPELREYFGPRDYMNIFVLVLVPSLIQLAIAQSAMRLRWPLYLPVSTAATLIVWLLCVCAVFELVDSL